MTDEPKIMIALPIETDIKLFSAWLIEFSHKFFFNLPLEDGAIDRFYADLHFQQIPGGHSGLYQFHINMELKNVKDTGDLIRAGENWYPEYKEISRGTTPIGSVRVEAVTNNSINAFFWSDILGGYLKAVFERIFIAICEDFFLNRPPENMIDGNIQPGKPGIIPPGEEPEISHQLLTATEVDILLSDAKLMRKFYKDYSPRTAKEIFKQIPNAWEEYEEGRWGPGAISKKCHRNPTTVGRYLRAFWHAGLKEFNMDYEIIPNPYKPRSKID